MFLAPDNGVLSLVFEREERVSVRHLTSEHYFHHPISNTFHGRDIFAPVAAYLSKGVDTAKFGEEITDFTRFAAPKPKAFGVNTWKAIVLKTDKFGNLITNITPKDAPMLFEAEPAPFRIAVGKKQITTIQSAYAQGAPGEVFGILGSMGYLEIAANRGSAAKLTEAVKGSDVNIILGESLAAGNNS